jgi:hypothetical protein
MAPTVEQHGLLLPEGSRLVHIGPPKTGTTAVQGALHRQRDALLAQGVRYAGQSRHSLNAVLAVTGRPSFATDAPPPIDHWERLMREVHRAKQQRVVISSEFFADAKPAAVRRIVDDVGRGRMHVVVTLRPLARIIPSQWQQYVQSGMRVSFDRWLDAMLNKPPGTLTPTFWQRHRHDRLIGRWADVVGADNLTVVVLDEHRHEMLLRLFERFLGLTDGTLIPEADITNRSMTWPEIETVRAFNVAFRERGLPSSLLHSVMHFGAANYMKLRQPPHDEPRIQTPQWALDRAAAIAREMVDAIAASGVRVIGDLERLTDVPASTMVGANTPDAPIPPEVAASAAIGVLVAGGLAPGLDTGSGSTSRWAEPLGVAAVPTRRLLGILPGRGVKAVVGRVRRIRRRFRGG